ncbi:MAG: BrnT family toxin [Chloroflexi bacterium]|nr:BrnT family toxin [Chloroflexota bacterium]
MRIRDFIWLTEILEKLEAKHQVSPEEVFQVFTGRPSFRFVSKGRRQKGEDVYAAYGQTESGRYLVVFFIRKAGDLALIVSARDMDHSESRYYGRAKQTGSNS